MLEIHNLNVSHEKKNILTEIDLRVEKSEIVSLLGPSGSGKTTLLRVIMGLEQPVTGTILYEQRALSEGKKIIVPPEKRNFSLVFQEFILFPHLDVYHNIAIGLEQLPKAVRRSQISELMELLEIIPLKERRVDTLSGGEQQRVALARSLALRPALLLLDEPFSNLDRSMKERLYGRLKVRLKQSKITTILATHDHAEAFFFSDKIHVLQAGRRLASAAPLALYSQPATPWVAAFIGEVNYLTGEELQTLFGIQAGGLKSEARYLIRPEEFQAAHLSLVKGVEPAVPATVMQTEFYGFYHTLTVALENGKTIKIKYFDQTEYKSGESVAVRINKPVGAILLTETKQV